MMFKYNKENFKKVLLNRNVLYIKEETNKNKKNLYAVVKIAYDKYIKLELTTPENSISFPYNPIHYFHDEGGHIILDNFVFLNGNCALNKDFLLKLGYTSLEDPNLIAVLAIFKDNMSTVVDIQKKKHFEKNGIREYERLAKERLLVNDNIEFSNNIIIEDYINSNSTMEKQKSLILKKN